MIRALALACFALVAGCGDDTTAAAADMAACPTAPYCCPATCTFGETCNGFESHCVCDSSGKWACMGVVLHDLAIPRYGD